MTRKLSEYIDAGKLSFITSDAYPAIDIANRFTTINSKVIRKDTESILLDLSKNGAEPDLVLMSWPPYLSDWTKIIRESTKISRYIIIGDITMVGGGKKSVLNSLGSDWKVRELTEMREWQLGASDEYNLDQEIDDISDIDPNQLKKVIFEARHSSTFYFEKNK